MAVVVYEVNVYSNKATGKKIRLKPHVDPALLGGVMLRIEDRIVDATLKKRLQLLSAAMKEKKVVK